jgi:archaetidylinositol phosphate synthase
VLSWMAARVPVCVTPDHLTLFGILGAVTAATGFVCSNWSLSWLWLANLGLAANWFGDSLDGTLARARRIERQRYGFFVDHTSDLFCQSLIFVSLGLSPLVHFAVACLGLIAFLIGFVNTLIGAHVSQTMRITYFGFGPTEIRALLLVGNVGVLAFGVVSLNIWAVLARAGIVLSGHDAVIASLSIVGIGLMAASALGEARRLAAEDPRPSFPSAAP